MSIVLYDSSLSTVYDKAMAKKYLIHITDSSIYNRDDRA